MRGNKNDHNDAFAITEASQRPYIRFVPIKTEHQQEISCLHRIRERLIKSKTALSNQSRGLLSEYNTTIERLNSIKNQLDEFVDESETGKILLSIPGIGVMNAPALLAAIEKG